MDRKSFVAALGGGAVVALTWLVWWECAGTVSRNVPPSSAGNIWDNFSPAMAAAEPKDKREWSEPINGLCARLDVTLEDCNPGLRHVAILELKNVSTKPISVIDRPHIKAELETGPGSPDPNGGIILIGPSGYSPGPQWGTIPWGATLSFRVDRQTVAAPIKDEALLAVGGVWWIKPGGSYVLRTKLISTRVDGPKDQWAGEMTLPPVAVAVTKEQVIKPQR